jgi:hypothetical protein
LVNIIVLCYSLADISLSSGDTNQLDSEAGEGLRSMTTIATSFDMV